MNSASVGFQCPQCVKEGNKGSRQGRTPYGGQRVADPRLTSFVLIGLNVVVWLLITGTGGRTSALLYKLALIPNFTGRPLSDGTGVYAEGVAQGAWWQPLTVLFTHEQGLHIAFNMLALYFLGPTLENVLGRTRFLALYLVSGLTGSAAVMLLSNANGVTVGASGAIFGLMGALAVVALKVRGQMQSVLMWIGLNLAITFTVPSISWQGHIGGLVGGALIGTAMVYAPRERRALVQWTATGLILAVAVALIVVRAVALSGPIRLAG
jgi:membrane associated rhomboid family serine protease